MACVKMMILALLLPCAATHDQPKHAGTPCPKEEARDSAPLTQWAPGRGFAYARY